jgi:hypothetical protein
MKFFYSLLIVLFTGSIFCQTLKAQIFEGELIFIKETNIDTSFFSYKIKDNKVRFEEYTKNKPAESFILADLKTGNIFSVSPKMKIFTELPVNEWKANKDSQIMRTEKTGNYKTIQGIKCYQWRVQNKTEDTEISFWISAQQFPFYTDFQKMLNKPEKISQYYLDIPSIHGFLPFESVERSTMRELRLRYELISMEKKNLHSSLFEIPQGYKVFEKN